MTALEIVALFGIPSAITGFSVFLIKRKVEKNEYKRRERESNLEALVLMMMQTTRANTVGITAIAKAVQRIPDANCNGDMTDALEEMALIQKKEQQFIIDKGIKYIFE